MHKPRTVQRIEFEIFLAILGVAALNVFVFAGMAASKDTYTNLWQGLETAVVVYGFFLVSMLLFILFHNMRWLKYTFIGLLTFMLVHILSNLFYLIVDPNISDNGSAILADALLIWIVNILVFGLWYWFIDRGGPIDRAEESEETRIDLLFPQYQSQIPKWEHWKPKFLDYIFFSFFTSSSFAPADTLPLTKRVKVLMMIQALVSLVIIGMVASRAINLIQ